MSYVLTQLTKKGKSFVWANDEDTDFVDLKKAFTSAPIPAHVDLQKLFIIEADTSDFALGSILSQQGDGEKLHLVAFHSCKFDIAEINYEVHGIIIDSGFFCTMETFSRRISSSNQCIQ